MDNNQVNSSVYEEEGLSFSDLLQIIKRHLIAIILCVGVFFSLMMVYSFSIQKPVYSSSATVMANPTTSSSSTGNDYLYIQRIMSTYEILFKSRMVLGEVSENIKNYENKDGTVSHLNYSSGQIYSMTSVSILSGSSSSNSDSLVFSITVSGYIPEDCAIIANEIVKVTQSLPQTGGDFTILKNSTLTSVDKAVPNYGYSKHLFKNGLIGIALGGIIAVAYIVLKELTNTTINDTKTIERELNLNVLTIVPDFETLKKEEKFIN